MAPPPVPTPTPAARRPNIVVVLADDLDVPTTAMLPRLPDLVENKGISFTRAYATQPLCAPSRASILTGQYAHNHGVTGNEPPSDGFVAFRRHEGATIATWLKSAGYRTALVGKYMNAYAWGAGEGYIPPGWDEWYGHLAALEDNRYWDYWVNDNRDVYRHGHAPEDYSVDLETKRAVSVHPRLRRPARADLPLRRPPGPPHARVLRGALRGRVPLLVRATSAVVQRERRAHEAVLDPADRVHDRHADRRPRPLREVPPAQHARGRGGDRVDPRRSPRRGASRTPTSSSSPTTVSCSASTARSAGRTTSTRRRSASRSWCAAPGSLPRKVDESSQHRPRPDAPRARRGADPGDGGRHVARAVPARHDTAEVADRLPRRGLRTRADARGPHARRLYTHNDTEEFELYDMTTTLAGEQPVQARRPGGESPLGEAVPDARHLPPASCRPAVAGTAAGSAVEEPSRRGGAGRGARRVPAGAPAIIAP